MATSRVHMQIFSLPYDTVSLRVDTSDIAYDATESHAGKILFLPMKKQGEQGGLGQREEE